MSRDRSRLTLQWKLASVPGRLSVFVRGCSTIKSLVDRRVVVTGASSGLGFEMARQLAVNFGARAVLVARDSARLQAAADALSRSGGHAPEVFACDLAEPGASRRLFDGVTRNYAVDAIISNAAVLGTGPFEQATLSALSEHTAINGLSIMEQLNLFLPYFDSRGAGGAMIVTGMAAIMPVPFHATYAATKSMIHRYAESIQCERQNRPGSPHLTLCVPAGFPSGMLRESPIASRLSKSWLLKYAVLPVERVASESLAGFVAGKRVVVPGKRIWMLQSFMKFLPAEMLARRLSRIYRER